MMEKHGNTWFPGDRVRRRGDQRTGRITHIDVANDTALIELDHHSGHGGTVTWNVSELEAAA